MLCFHSLCSSWGSKEASRPSDGLCTADTHPKVKLKVPPISLATTAGTKLVLMPKATTDTRLLMLLTMTTGCTRQLLQAQHIASMLLGSSTCARARIRGAQHACEMQARSYKATQSTLAGLQCRLMHVNT